MTLNMLSPFIYAVTGLTASKLWHDTLRLFVTTFHPECSPGAVDIVLKRQILESYLSWNVAGVMIGGIMAGLLTDSITPNKTFPASVGIIGATSLILIGISFFPGLASILVYLRVGILILSAFLIIQGKTRAIRRIATMACLSTLVMVIFSVDSSLNLLFIRGFAIAVAMNSAYVAVGDMYRGDPFLPTASNYLYLTLFGSLAICPWLLELLPKKAFFIAASTLMLLLAFLLKQNIPKTKYSVPSFRRYFSSWPTLLVRPEFLLCCGASMICIGGFYNILYIFADAAIHHNYSGNIGFMQLIGRSATLFTLVLMYLFGLLRVRKLELSSRNCAQYMSLAMLIVSFALAILLKFHFNLPLGLTASVMFVMTCLATGLAQPAAKTAIIAIGQKGSVTGGAQSFVTLMNSAIEYGGCKIILACSYPQGARIYLGFLVFLTFGLASGLFIMRKKINGNLPSKGNEVKPEV